MKRFTVGLRAGTAGIALAIAAVAAPAMAQDATQTQETTEAEQNDTIVVTGSRIQSPNIRSVAPIQSVTAEQITDSGVVNIQELLQENPAFGAPTLSRTNTAFLTSGTGIASTELRNLGTARTLVLINGRRVVSGVPGAATVDLNVIPTQFLQTVDTLTGGSSSLYGSDAVAGVVNFIYRDNFEGVEANAQYGITERGDSPRYQANLTAGGNFADGRGNMMVHLGYTNESGLLSRQRPETALDDVDTFFFVTGDPADYGVASEGALSGFAPQGRFTAGGRTFTYSPTGQLQEGFSTPVNGFNRQFFRTIAVPVERYLFAARGHFDVSDNVRVFAEGTYNNTRASREIEPFALQSNGVNGIFPGVGGAVPLQTLVNGALVRNPFVPDAIFNAATDTNGDGIRDIQFARRISEFGTRNGSTNRDFYRFVVGLEGQVFGDFRWDVSYNYGRTAESQQSNGQVNVLNFRNALSAIPGENGTVVCADPNARAQGCVPINIYGAGSISPEAVAYIAADQTLQTTITQQQAQANLSGTLVELPAGPLAIAVGAEYRKESSVENNDALTNAGLNAGNALPDTSGSFDVREAYGEINIPLLADTTLFQALNLRAAGRVSDYSTVGTVYTWNVGGDWTPFNGLRFRGTYASSVRAPNIGELFQGPAQTFPTGISDPCIGIGATGGGTLGDNCRAAPGVLANIAANGTFTATQLDTQGISGFNSGNPDLEEESSRSWTVGAVLSARDFGVGGLLSSLTLSVDYFNIDIDNVITAPPRQFTLNQCYQQNVQAFCDLIDRRAVGTAVNSAGSLEFINAPALNGGQLLTDGIDAVLSMNVPVGIGSNGRVGLRVSYTHLFRGYLVPLPGAPRDNFAGEIGTPNDRFTTSLVYSNDDLRLNLTGTYLAKSFEDDLTLASYDVGRYDVSVPARFYLDSQLTVRAGDKMEFFVGADNLLDTRAPNILSGSPFNTTGTDTAANVYDVFGRRYYSGARLRF
ncbi:TonB-dependent receptor [Sphingomonas sp. BGYR3]|uniref:TonB-dependent receptor domain-containing protein n=1 Tax=Sphingomonas sp. BGYR3 TaxID=2975483 RepID=UPI0021A27296|nr:TonB-dependent receptor [Sphingomonas sp. BGYR3]MDG5487913.1 TonB-dependent receptor [Sphingomonas sp. BGYR3]